MKKLLIAVLTFACVPTFASEVVVTKCNVKSSTWPVQFVRNEQTGNMDQKPFTVQITQDDPNSFARDTHQNGIDLMFPLKISLHDKVSIENIIPEQGFSSGSLVITPSKFLKKRILRLGLISDSVSAVLEIKGETLASKNFNAQLTTIAKSGATAIANLVCMNIKN